MMRDWRISLHFYFAHTPTASLFSFFSYWKDECKVARKRGFGILAHFPGSFIFFSQVPWIFRTKQFFLQISTHHSSFTKKLSLVLENGLYNTGMGVALLALSLVRAIRRSSFPNFCLWGQGAPAAPKPDRIHRTTATEKINSCCLQIFTFRYPPQSVHKNSTYLHAEIRR